MMAPQPVHVDNWAGRGGVPPEAVPASDVTVGASRPSAGFEAIYREHFRFVWRCARRLGVEGPSVDDVVQEAFLVVHRRLADFEGRSSTRTWLYGIIRRVVADHRRTLRRKPAHGADSAEPDFERMHDESGRCPESRLEQSEQLALVRRMLSELDEDKREVFVLTELEGMTMAEISEALEVNPNTVSSRVRAARHKFEEGLARATVTAEEGSRK
jgi:RNA polymerase sigma-70 factor (ECF subfamily)